MPFQKNDIILFQGIVSRIVDAITPMPHHWVLVTR